jgi:2',3'-cyclic-nucleotide 2'-phosphodiesterase (5'-nucleotidase family)
VKVRAFVPLVCVFAAVSCAATPPPAPASSPAASAGEARFTILQLNDVYKIEGLEGGRIGGLARVRTLRKQLESEGRPVLVLHAGDLLFPSVMSKYLRAQPMIRALNLLDGDPAAFDPNLVVVFGNHEFDDRDPGVLLGRIAQSDFAWVSSNTRYRSVASAGGIPFSDRLANVHDVVVKDVGGSRVGILGLTVDAQPRDYVAYEYSPEQRREAIARALERLRNDGAAAVVALTHQDLEEDERGSRATSRRSVSSWADTNTSSCSGRSAGRGSRKPTRTRRP